MKKRFLLAAMACAVALSGFGFVKAEDAGTQTEPQVDPVEKVTEARDEENAKVEDKLEMARLWAIIEKAITINYDKDATDEEVKAYQAYYGIASETEAWEKLSQDKKDWIAKNPWAKVADKYAENNGLNEEGADETPAKAEKKALPNTAAVR